MASESLIWHLIRDNNSFLVKRGQTKRDGSVQFSKEPGNLLGVHSFKYSGLANNKAIDLQATTGPKATVVLKKKVGRKLGALSRPHIFPAMAFGSPLSILLSTTPTTQTELQEGRHRRRQLECQVCVQDYAQEGRQDGPEELGSHCWHWLQEGQGEGGLVHVQAGSAGYRLS